MKRLLNGNENAVIVGMSAPGTPGLPHFTIEIGEVFTYSEGNTLHEEDHRRGIIDRGFCIPSGINKGWIGVRGSLIPEGQRLEIYDLGLEVELRLLDKSLHKVSKSHRIPKSVISDMGFDLKNVDDADGRILPKALSQYLWEFV